MSEPGLAEESARHAAAASETTPSSLQVSPPEIDRPLVVHRLIQIGLFTALTWKWAFFAEANRVYAEIPLYDPFFPDLLRSLGVVRLGLLGALAGICGNFFSAGYPLRLCCSITTLLSVTVLCLHQASYNDATFTTAWWTSLWGLWFVRYVHSEGKYADLRRPALLSRLIISMVLLGGGVGKWTAEYWSGEVLYQIYFVDRDFWVFNHLRGHFDEPALRQIAMWYSRQVVVIETICGFGLWLLPPRWAAVTGIVVFTSIAVFSNWLLFSVLLSVIALSAVGLFVRE